MCYLYGLTVRLLSLAGVVLLPPPSAHAQTVKPQASAVGSLPPVPTPLDVVKLPTLWAGERRLFDVAQSA